MNNTMYYTRCADYYHSHTLSGGGVSAASGTSGSSGSTGSLDNRPPYYGLTFVMFDGDALPAGAIVYCSGSVPSGFALCNGGSGTPNLMDRMVISAGSSYGLGATGGENTNTPPSHAHSGSTAYNHTHAPVGATGGPHRHYVHAGSSWNPLRRHCGVYCAHACRAGNVVGVQPSHECSRFGGSW